jgi:hypothetical protein
MSKPSRFFLSPSDQAVRVELSDGDSTYATLRDDGTLTWHYGTPSERLENQALEAVLYDYGQGALGSAFGGFESLAEMDRQCSARCQTCRVVQDSHNDLSLHGDCSRCFVRKEAA